jgi:hypothetical protein
VNWVDIVRLDAIKLGSEVGGRREQRMVERNIVESVAMWCRARQDSVELVGAKEGGVEER